MKHNFGEAFMLMKYRDEDGETEILWNSRDGITPFCIASRSGKAMNHVEFHNDKYDPNYVPKKGERIFVDLTEEKARTVLKERIEKYWEHPEYPMKDMYDSKEDALEKMLKHTMEEWLPGGPPDIKEVE